MKTKELIELLLKADPKGEAEVMVANRAVLDACIVPMYYDGLGVLPIFDKQNEIVGINVKQSGLKLKLCVLDLKDVFLDNENPIVDLSDLPDWGKEDWTKKVNKLKAEAQLLKQSRNLYKG